MKDKSNTYTDLLKSLLTGILIMASFCLSAQFYTGPKQSFGKNRLQFGERVWKHADFEKYNLYYYGPGKPLAEYAARKTDDIIKEYTNYFDVRLNSKFYILIFNSQSEFRESNIGLVEGEESNIGGVTRIQGDKLFVFFEGDHALLLKQLRAGIAEMMIKQVMYGSSWKEMVKNSTLMTLPEWYLKGAVSYATKPWSVEIDNRLRDGVLSGEYQKFNHLSGEDAQFAGHALWNYIAEIYGPEVIPNVLYMTRISHNIESGFLFVLGVSLENLIIEAHDFYANKFEKDEKTQNLPDYDTRIRSKKNRVYQKPTLSPDGKQLAYVTNEFGQYKVFIYDIPPKKEIYESKGSLKGLKTWMHETTEGIKFVLKRKRKRVLKGSHRLDRLADLSYPVLNWHPSGEYLGVIYERKGEVILKTVEVVNKSSEERPLRRVKKVLDFSYSPDGKSILFTGVNKAQTDIYHYKLSTNSMKQITRDVFDDWHPRFIPNSSKIVFASNRNSDTTSLKEKDVTLLNDQFDLFTYDLETGELEYLVETKKVDERQPFGVEKNKYVFLSGENGVINKYLGKRDSTISHVDTTIHYRFFTDVKPLTNYKRNILFHEVNLETGGTSELIYHNQSYRTFKANYKKMQVLSSIPATQFQKQENQKTNLSIALKQSNKIEVKSIEVVEDETPMEHEIDINNYQFETDTEEQGKTEEKEKVEPVLDSRYIKLGGETNQTVKIDSSDTEFKMPLIENYRTAFKTLDITTQVSFNFSNQLYQRFNGGPYIAPGGGVEIKLGIIDLMEDELIEGGLRTGLGSGTQEYFISYLNRRKRVDKKYSFMRLGAEQNSSTGTPEKLFVHKLDAEFRYPFSEVLSFRTNFNVREDRIISQSVNDVTLRKEDVKTYWGGAKLALVFDNTRELGINIKQGTRWKIFGEGYYELEEEESDIFIFGLDYRKYVKIHRNLIWATRLSGSTSIGSRKLVYYLGGVQEWMSFGQATWDNEQNIANNQNYYFQTLASPLRGFKQNTRNGNSFALINTEIRWPVFQFFIKKPIRSEFVRSFQLVGFGDVGTAWSGGDPWGDENSFNTKEVNTGGSAVKIRLKNTSDPIVASYGLGVRAKLLGYFIRFDYAWGLIDYEIQDPVPQLSLSLDF